MPVALDEGAEGLECAWKGLLAKADAKVVGPGRDDVGEAVGRLDADACMRHGAWASGGVAHAPKSGKSRGAGGRRMPGGLVVAQPGRDRSDEAAMPSAASCAPRSCDESGPLKRRKAMAPALGRTHSKSAAWRATKASSSTRLRRMIARFFPRMASEARSAMSACSSEAREGEAVPKY